MLVEHNGSSSRSTENKEQSGAKPNPACFGAGFFWFCFYTVMFISLASSPPPLGMNGETLTSAARLSPLEWRGGSVDMISAVKDRGNHWRMQSCGTKMGTFLIRRQGAKRDWQRHMLELWAEIRSGERSKGWQSYLPQQGLLQLWDKLLTHGLHLSPELLLWLWLLKSSQGASTPSTYPWLCNWD